MLFATLLPNVELKLELETSAKALTLVFMRSDDFLRLPCASAQSGHYFFEFLPNKECKSNLTCSYYIDGEWENVNFTMTRPFFFFFCFLFFFVFFCFVIFYISRIIL